MIIRCLNGYLLVEVPLAGVANRLLHGVPHLCLQILMEVLVHQVISVAALPLEVGLAHQPQAAIEPMNLLLMPLVQILGHHQLLGH